MNIRRLLEKPGSWRALVQGGFLLWTIFIGVQFALFVRHFESGGAEPAYVRPPGVEGFLPIGALLSLRHWIASGEIHPVHPAALVLFVTILAVALLARKGFCSWICPVGTISDLLGAAGRRLFGRQFRIWRWLDIPLRGVKYLLLFFFLKIIVVDMPAAAMKGFLDAPYWALSDVKMLHFFTGMSTTALAVVLALAALSIPFRHFWCRYLCPYGALLGFLGWLSPFRIRRSSSACNGCGACARACPSRLAVDRKASVLSPECTGCLTCVESCPRGALDMAPPLRRRPFPSWAFAAVVLLVFATGIGLGMATGNWRSVLTYDDYMRLIPLAEYLSH